MVMDFVEQPYNSGFGTAKKLTSFGNEYEICGALSFRKINGLDERNTEREHLGGSITSGYCVHEYTSVLVRAEEKLFRA